MSVLRKAGPAHAPIATAPDDRPKDYYRAKPGGEIDYDALTKDVKRRFPKILARLAE